MLLSSRLCQTTQNKMGNHSLYLFLVVLYIYPVMNPKIITIIEQMPNNINASFTFKFSNILNIATDIKDISIEYPNISKKRVFFEINRLSFEYMIMNGNLCLTSKHDCLLCKNSYLSTEKIFKNETNRISIKKAYEIINVPDILDSDKFSVLIKIFADPSIYSSSHTT